MADTFKGIITADGKKRQLHYANVLEAPVSDKTLSEDGGFADAKVTGDNFAKAKEETDSLKGDLDDINDIVNGSFKYPDNYNYWQDEYKIPITTAGSIYAEVIAITGGSQSIYAMPVEQGATYAFLMWDSTWTDPTVVQAQNILQGAFSSDDFAPTPSNNTYTIVGNRTGALQRASVTVPNGAKWFIFALTNSANVNTLFWQKITDTHPSINVPTNNMEITSIGHEQRIESIEKPKNGKVWIAFGDSLTDSKTLGASNKNYTNFVSENLGLSMINFGKAGSGYWRTHEENNAFYQRADNIPTNFDIITIFGSFNDLGDDTLGTHGWQIIGSYDDTTDATICGCINLLIDKIYEKNPNAIIGIISPTPWATPSDGMYHANKEIEDLYITGIKSVAERRSIPFLDLLHCSNLRPWDNSFRNEYFLNGDGVHPNSNGHMRFSGIISDFIQKIMYVD